MEWSPHPLQTNAMHFTSKLVGCEGGKMVPTSSQNIYNVGYIIHRLLREEWTLLYA
jgi:hypothetical protein